MEYITWDRGGHLIEGIAADSTMEKAARLGISQMMIHLKKKDYPLKEYCLAAQKAGLEVHPWVKPAFAVKGFVKRTLSPERRKAQIEQYGFELVRACMNNQSTREKGLANIKELIDNFGEYISGIHLDYVRNDNALFLKDYPCECDACKGIRKKWLGHEVLTRDDLNNPAVMYKELSVRNNNITNFVREVRKLVNKTGMKLSMAARANYINQYDVKEAPVYGLGPAVYEGQDWFAWAEEGLLDFIATMNYHTDPDIFEKVFQDHLRLLADSPVEFYTGLGIESSMGSLTPEEAVVLIEKVKNSPAKGISLFHFEAITDEYNFTK
jgi:uncharacterized lipoprotein YddW (UPF0748 family)